MRSPQTESFFDLLYKLLIGLQQPPWLIPVLAGKLAEFRLVAAGVVGLRV